MKNNEPIENRTHFKNFGDFIRVLQIKSVNLGIEDWSHGKSSEEDYFCRVQFKNATIIVFHSKHYKWLSDITRILSGLINAK